MTTPNNEANPDKPKRDFNKIKPDLATFASRLRHFRHERKLSQRQLAELVGIQMVTVCRHELAERRPSSEIIDKYADVLGIDSWDLFVIE